MNTLIWLVFGIITVWLMYGDKEKIPIAKTVFIILFGGISFFIWLLFNLTTEVNNWLLEFSPKRKERLDGKNKRKT